MIRCSNLPDGLLKSSIEDSALSLSHLIQEALRREMKVELNVDVKMKSSDSIGEWSGIKVIITAKEGYHG